MERILIIEDEQALRETLVETLRITGYDVMAAADGEEGCAVAVREIPDLIICDVMMPRKNGYEVITELEKVKALKFTPFIFLSAKAQPADFRKGLLVGADDYLTKPFAINELLNVVKMRLRKRKEQMEVELRWKESIESAKMFQNVILPKEDRMKELFRDHFCLYLPKDIVSGDFYWMHQNGDRTYVAAADCTGHGMRAALISIICYEKLNAVIHEFPKAGPGDILNKINLALCSFLKKNSASEIPYDGMDISMCLIDQGSMKLVFSGSKRPLFMISENMDKGIMENAWEIKGDRYSIGKDAQEHRFTEHQFDIQPGDQIYMYSDGFADQFGGQNNKKFFTSNLKKTIVKHCDLPMNKQRDKLYSSYLEWKGENDQTDDILVLGIKI